MDINNAIDSFLAEINSYKNEYDAAIKGLTSANRERVGEKLQSEFLKKHKITIEKRGTLSITNYIKQYSGKIRLTVSDVSKQFIYKKVLLFSCKKEARRIDTLYKYNNKNICIDLWTSDKAKADRLKVGSVIELRGNFEISYYKRYDEEAVNIEYKGSKPDFDIVKL